jgi:hypothetical protein
MQNTKYLTQINRDETRDKEHSHIKILQNALYLVLIMRRTETRQYTRN